MSRLTIDLPQRADEALAELAKKNHTSKAEIVRRALALFKYVQEESVEKGHQLSIRERDPSPEQEGRILRDIVLPQY